MEKLTQFTLRRPVTTFLAVLSLVFFGFMAIMNSKLELMSSIDMPMMIITTTYPGASPEDIDKLVTKPIEDGAAVLSNVKEIGSYAMDNMSMVMVQYNYGTDMDQAYDDLKKKMDSIKADLPDDAGDPSFLEMNINDQPSMYLAVNNPSQDNMLNYVQNEIEPELEKLSTVASVDTSGGQAEYVQVQLIPEKMAQYHLDMSTVAQIVGAADFTYPAGTTGVGSQDLSVSTGADYDNVQDLQNIPIITGNGNTIYLKDIAIVKLALQDKTAIGRYNGSDTIMLSITKTQSDSAVTLSKDVMAEIKALEAKDANLQIAVIQDSADTITSSLNSVFQTIIMAVIISMVIIYIFFGDIKASLIVGTSIPLSILVALICMWAMGYSLNTITMSSLALGVGMMVDNSTVVLEACFRAMDHYTDINGSSRRRAAIESIKTVGESVMGSTITTCVVFLPLGFMHGLSGQFFAPLGFTIVFCMIASLLSAVTIVPLCYVMYRPTENTKAPAYRGVRILQDGYRSIMDRLLNHKALVMVTSVVLLILSFVLAGQLRSELMPQTDEGTVAISVEMRPGLKIEEQDKILKGIEDLVAADPDTDNYMVSAGGSGLQSMVSGGGSSVTAYLKDDRSMSTKEKADLWRKELDGTPNAVITVQSQSMMSTMSTNQETYQTIITATNYDKLKQASDAIVSDMQGRTDVTAVHSTMENAAPLVKVHVDPVKAAAEGISPVQVGQQLNLLLSGKKAMTMQVDDQDVSVMVEYPKDEYNNLEKVKDIYLSTPTGASVKLEDLADIGFEDSPATIQRDDRKYQATITADYTTSADARTKQTIDEEVIKKHLNNEVTIAENSQMRMMNEEFGALGMAIVIAIFLVFVVMAAQFESMRFSLMVMTTIPFSLIGSFFLLWIVDSPISMPSLLGFLMLIGTVVNNGILYVDTVNQYRMAMPIRRALIEAGATRLRPILMTTLTTVVSMVPMAIGFGKNGAMMQGLALVDVGGLTASTILALLMLPVYYSVMNRKKKNISRDVPDPGYMQGKNPEQENKRRLSAEKAYIDWTYSEGE
ncbi:MAG: efflux RND transporter permease subunit [Oribacterium sp.]|nr:efflux RND transporter permease subunit [Oribacterium sp.]